MLMPFFTQRGVRDKVNIKFVTPLSGAFTRPRASAMLGNLLKEKNIEIIPDFSIAEVDNGKKVIRDFADKEVSFDCLITIPVHMGAEMVIKSGLGDELGFIPTENILCNQRNSKTYLFLVMPLIFQPQKQVQ